MRIRTGAFGQLYSMDFQYSITLSSGFDEILFKKTKCNFMYLFVFNASLYLEVKLWIWLHFGGAGAYSCGVDVLMCHTMFALCRIEMY